MPRARKRLVGLAQQPLSAAGRALYRALSRVGRTFDESESARSLLARAPLPPAAAAPLARLLGRGAEVYNPGRTHTTLRSELSKAFRAAGPADLDAGFAALRYLSGVQAAAHLAAANPGPAVAPAGRAALVRTPGPGTVLVAHPALASPAFERTVVLLCEGVHGGPDGSDQTGGRRRRKGKRRGHHAAPPAPPTSAPRGVVLGRRLPATAETLAAAADGAPRPGRLHPYESLVLDLVRQGGRGDRGGRASTSDADDRLPLSIIAGLGGRGGGGAEAARSAPRVSVRVARISPSDLSGSGGGSGGGSGLSSTSSVLPSDDDEDGGRPLAVIISVSPGDGGESEESDADDDTVAAVAGPAADPAADAEGDGGGHETPALAALEAKLAGWFAEESGRALGADPTSRDTAGLAAAWRKAGDAPLFWGGPVPATLFLHADDDAAAAAEGTVPPEHSATVVLPPLSEGGAPVRRHFNAGGLAAPVDARRVFIGAAAWAPGQLEAELRAGMWIVAAADDAALRTLDAGDGSGAETVWKRVLRALGGPHAEWARLPREAVAAARAAHLAAVREAAAREGGG